MECGESGEHLCKANYSFVDTSVCAVRMPKKRRFFASVRQ